MRELRRLRAYLVSARHYETQVQGCTCVYCKTDVSDQVAVKQRPLDSQIGGTHYKDFAIQPIEFIHKNKISFAAGNVIKYVCRYAAKDGVKDLEKARHYIDMLIQMESK